jgi:ankyrin repeat protein
MSRSNQHAAAFLIHAGADIAALDTYRYTPMDRMASNNLAIGAQALLAFGADPDAHGPPFDVAMDAEAKDVLAVLERYETRVESKR